MNIYYVELFDYYGALFTDKQKEYFVDYYFNKLKGQGPFEIDENNLKLLENKKKIEKLIKDIDVNIKEKIEELI